MTTGMEAPQSSSFVGYYKGFSVTITKRDAEAEVKPLIDKAMQAIDYMLEKGFKPSWNDETNGKVLGSAVVTEPVRETPKADGTTPKNCPIHPNKVLFYNPNGRFGPFWSHKTDQVGGNGKPIYCNGVDKNKPTSVEEYERVQSTDF